MTDKRNEILAKLENAVNNREAEQVVCLESLQSALCKLVQNHPMIVSALLLNTIADPQNSPLSVGERLTIGHVLNSYIDGIETAQQ